jgi:DNA-directed RNA polymerase beta subunit
MQYEPAYSIRQPNQLYRDLMGVNSLNPWDGTDSSSRKQMFSSHIGQTLVIKGSTERRQQTGMEREYAKYTFSVKMPVNAQVIKVIKRYRDDESSIAATGIVKTPQEIIIYEQVETKEVGMIIISRYCSHHQYFGFEYRNQPALHRIRAGEHVAAGEILQDSPSVTPDGGYKYGRECNMAFMSHPACSEDGILISRDILPHFAFKTYETRVVEFGNKRFPLNLYGTPEKFKPFPDIGDKIREDGLLMCLRTYDESLAAAEQSIYDLMVPDFTFDKPVYAGGAGGTVIDIRVYHDKDSPYPTTPVGMEVQARKYDEARRASYLEILELYRRLKRDRPELQITPEFQRLVVEAISVVGDNKGKRVVKLFRQAPLDDYRIEFVVEYDIVPTTGFKLTDCHGGKGVICQVAEPWQMPVDEAGNRADIVMDPNSTVSRMNIGRLYEQYINAAGRDVAKEICHRLNIQANDLKVMSKLGELDRTNRPAIDMAWEYLLGFYKIVSPKMFVWFTDGEYGRSRLEHLAEVITKGVYLYMPPENDPEPVEMIKALEKFYRPTYGPVTYVGNSGRKVTTKLPVRIGSMYIILLEKIGDDWTAVSSGKLQHFGVLSQVTNTDKYSSPTRTQAIRALGEAEVRIYVSYAGPRITAEILDRNNNPKTHQYQVQRILEADQPTNILNTVDRGEIPLGGSKPLQLVKHVLECGGTKFRYTPHLETTN